MEQRAKGSPRFREFSSRFAKLFSVLDCGYDETHKAPAARTSSGAGCWRPVSAVLGGAELTGCFSALNQLQLIASQPSCRAINGLHLCSIP